MQVSADSASASGDAGAARTVELQTPSAQVKSAVAPTAADRTTTKNSSRLTLEEAVRKAIEWHPSIDQAVARIQQSTAEIDVARAGYYPKITGGLGTSYQSYKTTDRGWSPTVNVNASQMIYDFGKVSSSVEARTAGAKVSETDLLLGVDTLAREIATAVIEVQRYQALVAAAQAQLEGVRAIADLVRERSGRGASTKSDEVQADARVNSAESQLLEISGQLDRWQSTLANLLGNSGPVSVSPQVPQWFASVCTGSEPDWSQSSAILQAEARKAEAEAQLKNARAQAYPTLALEAGAGYDLNDSSTASDDLEFRVGLNMSGTLYDGGATAANRRAADHALAAADAAIRNARLELGSNLSQARSQIASLQRMLGSLSERQDLLIQTRDLYRQQYVELGTRTLLDLLNAEQELHQAEFDKANATHDLRRLGLDCMFNSGRTRELLGLKGMTVRGMTL